MHIEETKDSEAIFRNCNDWDDLKWFSFSKKKFGVGGTNNFSIFVEFGIKFRRLEIDLGAIFVGAARAAADSDIPEFQIRWLQ